MNTIKQTKFFRQWFDALKDMQGKRKIAQRIERAEMGNFGDHKQIADNLFEMRIFYGPGYRLYYTKQGNIIYLLLLGGDKATQTKDIEIAKEMVEVLKKGATL